MEELKINTRFSISSLEELEVIKSCVYNLLGPKAITTKNKFDEVFEYNRKIIIDNIIDKTEKINYFKKIIKNKSQLTEILKQVNSPSIIEADLDTNFIIQIEKKLFLEDIYKSFSKYCLDLLENAKNVKYIKIYDFYQNKSDFNSILNNLNKKQDNLNDINRFLAFIRSEANGLDPSKIKVLTTVNSEQSFEFYSKLYNYKNHNYKDSNIKIKYIPESTSRNTYIPSLFYIIVKYEVGNKNYKYLTAYLESSTNWGVVTTSYHNAKSFTNQFFNLLNTRFDEQYESSSILFKPKNNEKYDFESDVTNIFTQLKKHFENNDSKEVNKVVLNEIHTLKTKYKTINYAYKLLKSFYYYYSYLNIIKNSSNEKELPNTNKIIRYILKNNLTKETKKLLVDIEVKSIDFTDIDIYKLRLSMIEKIDNKKAICDIFPTMKWTDKIDIVQNLEEIKSNNNYLEIFFKELGIKRDLTVQEKQDKFKLNVIEKIKKGEKIKI